MVSFAALRKLEIPVYERTGFSQCRNAGRVPLFIDGESHCKYLGSDTPWNIIASYNDLLLFLILCILLLSNNLQKGHGSLVYREVPYEFM